MRKFDLEGLADHLPQVVARTHVPQLFGWIVSAKTLANEDSRGTGPDGRFRVGRKVCYKTDLLIEWLKKRSN